MSQIREIRRWKAYNTYIPETQTKTCQNCQAEFRIEPEDFAFYEKVSVPPPTWCPRCRFQRRMIWRNEKIFYKRKCDATGKEIFSMFSPDAPIRVYERNYWWSDQWNPLDYGKEYDFSRPFLEQLKELVRTVPLPSRSFLECVRSDYCMNCSNLKDCYMTFDADHSENLFYSVGIQTSKDCADMLSAYACELCYDCFSCRQCYMTRYSVECEDCRNVTLSKDCRNCSDCFGCVGLRNRSYCIFNEQYTREEYEKEIARLDISSYANLLKYKDRVEALSKQVPVRYMHGTHNQNVSGDYIYHSKNVHNSFLVRESEDCRYCHTINVSPGSKQCYDYDLFGWNAELVYESNIVGYNASNVKFSAMTYLDCLNAEYCFSCISSVQNLFGCIGLRNKSYCILNKQYSKDEYLALLPKIKQHMDEMPYVDAQGREYRYGEFFPPELSPFAYNESLTQEYLPLSKEEALAAGFAWRDSPVKQYETSLSWRDLPDRIADVDDSILGATILCQDWDEDAETAQAHNCTKAFRITKPELEFYRRMQAPLPRKCFYGRHRDRTLERTPLFAENNRQCMCDYAVYPNTAKHPHHPNERCPNRFETSYAPARPEIVYCEQCYQAEAA